METKAWVDRSLQKRKELDSKYTSKNESTSTVSPASSTTVTGTPQSPSKDVGAFTVQTALAVSTYHLQGSWILDNGSDSHVCNSTMLSRFTKTCLSNSGDRLMAGNQALPIECYGTIQITISTPTGPQTMTLLDVAYVSDFITNIVAQDKLRAKRVYFDNWKMHLHREGNTIGHVTRHGGHYLLEDNINFMKKQPASFATTTKSGSMRDWHQILGHASNNAITHLENLVEGVKVVDQDPVPKTSECETCALFKSHQIVSRSSDKSKKSDKPFHQITYDLMQFTIAMNKDQWVSHFACAATDFKLVFTHLKKSDAVAIIQKAVNIIETRYDRKVVFF